MLSTNRTGTARGYKNNNSWRLFASFFRPSHLSTMAPSLWDMLREVKRSCGERTPPLAKTTDEGSIENPHIKATDTFRSKVPARASTSGASWLHLQGEPPPPACNSPSFECIGVGGVNGPPGRRVWPVVFPLPAAGRLQRSLGISRQATRAKGNCVLKNVAPCPDGPEEGAHYGLRRNVVPLLALRVLTPSRRMLDPAVDQLRRNLS